MAAKENNWLKQKAFSSCGGAQRRSQCVEGRDRRQRDADRRTGEGSREGEAETSCGEIRPVCI